MGRNHGAASLPHGVHEKVRFMHPKDVAVQSKDQYMSVIGVDLAAGQHQEIMPSSQIADLLNRPEGIMVGEADSIQARFLGFIY
jgi:hypothetical protein